MTTSSIEALLPAGWIFQANPDHFADRWPLDDYVREARGKQSSWYVGQHPNEIRPEQPVFIWRAQGRQKPPQRGLIAYGKIESSPKPFFCFRWERKYERRGNQSKPEVRSILSIERTLFKLGEFVPAEKLMADPVLQNMRILTAPRGSNFPLTAEQVKHISALLGEDPNQQTDGVEAETAVLARISFNSSGWKRPTGDAKKTEGPKTFNRIHGFGYEDWLFRTEWQLDGWHYGFVQAFNRGGRKYAGKALDVTLFTIDPQKQRRCVADVSGLEVLDDKTAQDALRAYKHAGWFDLMRKDVAAVDGKTGALASSGWASNLLNVRFRPENVRFAPAGAVLENDDWLRRRWRYIPYEFQNAVRDRVGRQLRRRLGLGHAAKAGSKQFRRGCIPTFADPVHRRMALKLEGELRKEFPGQRLVFEEDWVDAKLEIDVGLILFELKSDLNPRAVIRQAIGQLLEYAYRHPPHQPIHRLVIVGRMPLPDKERDYIERLRSQFALPVEYRCVRV